MTTTKGTAMSEVEREAAVSWVADCGGWAECEDMSFSEVEEWAASLPDGVLRRGIERSFVGGWDEFVRVSL